MKRLAIKILRSQLLPINGVWLNKENCRRIVEAHTAGKEIPKLLTRGQRHKRTDPNWKAVRDKAVDRLGNKCSECKRVVTGADLHVDHILPKSKFPELVYAETNLRILCRRCNFTKSAHREHIL